MTLRDLAAYALQHSPSLNSAQRETLISTLERKNSGSAFLPSLDLSTAHGWQRSEPPSGSSPWTSNLSLELAETLYDNGQTITRHKTSKLREEEAGIQLLQTRDQLLLDLAEEFFRHSLATKELEVQEEQHALLKKQYQMVEAGYRQGIKTRKDYLRFKTQLSRADIDLVNAKNALVRSEQALMKLIGMPLGANESISLAVDDSKPGAEPIASIPIENHREYRISELENGIQRLEESQVKRRLWPELSLTAGATYGSGDYLGTGAAFTANDRLGWNALLSLRYNFLDWGTRRREARIAGERTEIQLNASESKLLDLRQQLASLRLDLQQFRENFRLGSELLELERRNLALITTEYRQGKVQYLDYITSLKDFASAQVGYYSSLYQLKKGLLTQKFHQGTLYETILGR
jgi:outer membrane protein TolC